MAQAQVSKKHHYLPEFYLKRWAIGGRLVQFSKPYGNLVKAKPVHPSETGFVNKLYALEGFSGTRASTLEDHYFQPVDTRAADALARLEVAGAVVNDRERVGWGQFLLSLVLRHPENVALLKARFREAVLTTTPESEKAYRRGRGATHPPTLREAIELKMTQDPGRVSRAALGLVADGASSDKLGNHLINMIWGSLTFPFDIPALFTSDRPVHWFNPLSSPDCHILVPIGPKRLFWAANAAEWAMLIRSRSPDMMAGFINEHTTRRPQRLVYATTDRGLPYVQNLMGNDPEKNTADIATKFSRRSRIIRDKRRAIRSGSNPVMPLIGHFVDLPSPRHLNLEESSAAAGLNGDLTPRVQSSHSMTSETMITSWYHSRP